MIAVGIYIKVPKSSIIPFSADITTRTADTTSKTADAISLGTATIDYQRLDLFDDEKISLTSSIQDVADISKTLTDYTQSFTIPASTNNNEIFKYWAENKIDNGFDSRLRIDSYITLDGIVFRNGLLQLEKVQMKNEKPENYTITFFGNLLSLKDIFDGLLLSNLTALGKSFEYVGWRVIYGTNGNAGNNNDIAFPLISSLRNWNYGIGDNINVTAIDYRELFPAIRIRTIFEMIEYQFGISFSGDFLNNPKFTNAYIFCKNADKFVVNPIFTPITYQSSSFQNYGTRFLYDWGLSGVRVVGGPTGYSSATFTARLFLTCSMPGIYYTVNIYRNDVLFSTFNQVTQTIQISLNFIYSTGMNVYGYNGYWRAEISSAESFSYTGSMEFKVYSGNLTYDRQTMTKSTSSTIVGMQLSLASMMPAMKIEDFFTGLLKMWNLTCYAKNPTNYIIETIDDYYANAETFDITEYKRTEEIEVNRLKWYKRIAFTFQKSTSYMQSLFWGVNGRGYGDLSQSFDVDGGEYKIELPFEQMLFENIGNISNLQVGKCLSNTLTSYTPKPLILYDFGNGKAKNIGGSIKTYSELDGVLVQTKIMLFGNDYKLGNNIFSGNWGAEYNDTQNVSVPNGLYMTGYLNYLLNLYDQKARMIKVKSKLPLSVISKLKPNNRVILKDKKYLINSFTTDLTSLETSFELINDFREADEYVIVIFKDQGKYPLYTTSTIVGYNGWQELGPQTTTVMCFGSYGDGFLDYRGQRAHLEFFFGNTGTAGVKGIKRSFENPRLGKIYYSALFDTTDSNNIPINTTFLVTGFAVGNIDYCNVFFRVVLVGTIKFWNFGLSRTSLTTPDIWGATNFKFNYPFVNGIDMNKLIVLKYEESTQKASLFVIVNSSGELDDSLLPNLEPTPLVDLILTNPIIPDGITIRQNSSTSFLQFYLCGTRIATAWDIKF